MFDRLFFASLALSLVNSAVSYSAVQQQFSTDPALAPVGGFAGPFFVVSLVVGFAISLLLWFFISRRASDVAKWIQVVFTAFGVLGVVQNLTKPMFGAGPLVLMVVLTVLQVAAVYFLFRPDAKAWFAGQGPVDTDVFK